MTRIKKLCPQCEADVTGDPELQRALSACVSVRQMKARTERESPLKWAASSLSQEGTLSCFLLASTNTTSRKPDTSLKSVDGICNHTGQHPSVLWKQQLTSRRAPAKL